MGSAGGPLNTSLHHADTATMAGSESNDRTRHWLECSSVAGVEDEAEWDAAESEGLVRAMASALMAMVEAGVPSPDLVEPRCRDDLDRAVRAWARVQPSLSVLRGRMNCLTPALEGLASDLMVETMVAVVGVAAHEEFAAKLQHAALSDPLTGLGNRRALESSWRSATTQCRRLARPLCLVAIDLDGLKRINDLQGHAAGDEAIVGLCRALRAGLRDTDQLFRIGGDEFVALLPGTAAAGVGDLIERVDQYHGPRFSWGAADTVMDGDGLDLVLACADQRLYAQRRRVRRPLAASVAPAPVPRQRPWDGITRRRAVEVAVTGVLMLAIGAIVTTITGGNHALCSAGDGPSLSGCGLSSALYDAGWILVISGALTFGLGLVAAAFLGASGRPLR